MIEEIITPAQTVYVEAKCPKCEDGKLIADGMAYMTNPPLYPHLCDKCGHMEKIRGEQYPYTRVEKEEKECE